MTKKQNDNIKRLLKLAFVSQEFEHVDLQTVDKFNELREELGLSTLLLTIEEYVKSKNQPESPPPQTTDPNQNLNVVQ